MTRFITKATPINNINNKYHNKESRNYLTEEQKLFGISESPCEIHI